MADHRERCEKGAGFAWLAPQGHFKLAKALDHQEAFNGYADGINKSPFYLFHSRLPSEGPVTMQNVQPFASGESLFAHNGTISSDTLQWACMSAGVVFNGEESDSLLMFKLINHAPFTSVLAILKSSRQNYIIVNPARKEVHIIGHFNLVRSEDDKHILEARNIYAGNWGHYVTDYKGRIIFEESYRYYQPKTTTWSQCDFIDARDVAKLKPSKIKEVDPVIYEDEAEINGSALQDFNDYLRKQDELREDRDKDFPDA